MASWSGFRFGNDLRTAVWEVVMAERMTLSRCPIHIKYMSCICCVVDLDMLPAWSRCARPITNYQSPAGDLFAVSVVGCLLGYSSCLVVWIPLFLDPSDGVFGRFDLAALCGCRTLNFCLFVYQLPNGPVKAGRRWGQRHPQGANLGSNGIHNFMSKLKQWLPPAHPKSLASQCMSGQPISTCHALTS